jgi:hypothetical protein
MSKLLVIDDQEFDYLPLFQNEGYTVVKWDDVPNLQRLETSEFHVVLLDLKGVGRQFSSAEGAGIIHHIRETNPAQIIIAYTSARHTFAHQHFIDKADYRIPKSEDFAVFKRRVDEGLERRFSEDFYLSRIDELLLGAGVRQGTLHRRVRKAIWTKDATQLRQWLLGHSVDPHTIDRVLAVCSIASNIIVIARTR